MEELPDLADVASKLQDIVVDVDDKSRFLLAAVNSTTTWLRGYNWSWATGKHQVGLGEAHLIEHMCSVSYASIRGLGCESFKSEARHVLASLVSLCTESQVEDFARRELGMGDDSSPVVALKLAAAEPPRLGEQPASTAATHRTVLDS